VLDPTGSLPGRQGNIVSSYGINNWVYDPPPGVGAIQGRNTAWSWRKFTAPFEPSNTPLFGDAMWRGGGPHHNERPPAFNGEWRGYDAEFNRNRPAEPCGTGGGSGRLTGRTNWLD